MQTHRILVFVLILSVGGWACTAQQWHATTTGLAVAGLVTTLVALEIATTPRYVYYAPAYTPVIVPIHAPVYVGRPVYAPVAYVQDHHGHWHYPSR